MKRTFIRTISLFLAAVMLMGALPLGTLAAELNSPDTYTLSNGFIEVNVSKKNGGFDVRTVEGDKLNKDDNNKNLLFPLGENDTSFTSFRVTRGGETKDYIFGGKYSFLGLTDQAVDITQDATGITAAWGVADLKFTQRIELANMGSSNHGMAYISYKAETTGAPADIEARVLMDTALGYQDFAVYELSGSDSSYTRVEKEGVYSNAEGSLYEKTFFAYDDVHNPTILAYTVNSTINEKECIPEKVAFGHWNNLAASVYDFVPDPGMTFTNPYNKKYLTADSAYALYFDMGTVTSSAPQSIATNYGVYSNEKVSDKNTVAVNLAAPSSMELADNKKEYLSREQGGDPGDFTVQTYVENFKTDTSKVYDKVKVAVYCQTGIVPVSGGNILQSQYSYSNPYTREVNDFKVDETKTIMWDFNAAVGTEASYRKVQFKVYNVSKDVDPTGSGQLLEENLLGEAYCYILCPGGDGKLPEIKFTGSSPEIIYNEGNRHLFLTGTNFNMLENKGEYNVIAKSLTDAGKEYKIPAGQFLIDTKENTIDVLMTEKMNTGNYQLVIDYTDSGKKDIAAPAMLFTVSDDKAYRNDGYGVLAIVQKKDSPKGNPQYEVKTFGSESAYEKAKSSLGEVLIELKGEFVATDNVAGDGTILKYTGVSTGKGKNVMTVNNCIDVENGNLSVSINKYGQSNQSIDIDFDAELYTTGARTVIWKSGISALTSIENGTDYELIQYDEFGERSNNMSNKEPISLIWPSAAGAAQTIGGMIFDFRYGELGVIELGDKERRVIAFGAMLDLSFIIPSNAKKSEGDLDLYDKVNLAFFADSRYTPEYARHAWESHKDQVRAEQEADKGEGEVKVKDVLFGGEYLGFNVNVKVQIPGYTPAMPTMAADLSINTIGNWAVAVDGMCKFTKLEMEASISIKSKDGYPVPDKLYFFIKGFTPGVNIDGFGVVWLQGGGGGIENLYDTIFATDSIPPLKLLISAQLSIMQVFSARADLALSLRGIGIKISNGVIMDTDIKVLNHAQLQFEWYPEFYFMAAASVNVFNVITGGGYIVVESDGFFEFYVKAAITIPDEVLFIGGIKLGSVDLGASSHRIWGGIEIIGIRAGICYYWGGDFSFGFGGNAPQPTYPELLGKDDIPVYTDPETGRVLYMHVGTNFELASKTELVESMKETTLLMDAGSSVKSQAEKKEHKLILGDKGGNDAILSMSFTAESKEKALEIAEQIKITDESTKDEYTIKIYNQEFAADAEENKGTNANLTYNSETKRAGLNVTFTDASYYNKAWDVLTPDAAADLLLYNVLPMASLDSVTATINSDRITAAWDGNDLGRFESMSFMAVKSPESTEGALIYKISDTAEIQSKTTDFTLPDTLESGTYYMRATAVKDGELCEVAVTNDTFTFTNPKLPNMPQTVTAISAGDLKIKAEVTQPAGEYDGYLINIYEEQDGSWILSSMGGIEYEKSSENMTVGGSYSFIADKAGAAVTQGLEPGKPYKLGVSSYRIDKSDPDNIRTFYSSEKLSASITLSAPDPAEVTLDCKNAVPKLYSSGEEVNISIDTFKAHDAEIKMTSDQMVSGTWTLNKGYVITDEGGTRDTSGMTGTITNSNSEVITFTGLEDGNHMLTFVGKNSSGDGVIVQKRFGVDTLPPRLLLESPVNGGFFEEDGTLVIEGITDKGTTITVNGKEYSPTVDSEGKFSITVNLDKTMASHDVLISASDEVGNQVSQSMTLKNKALGKITGARLYADGQDVTNKSLTGEKDTNTGLQRKLELKAELAGGEKLVLNDSRLVSWNVMTVAGSAAVNDDGTLTAGAGARGMISGKLDVSEEGGFTAASVFGLQSYQDTKEDYYNITVINPPVGGTIGVSQTAAKEGTPITITAAPAEGYKLKYVKAGNDVLQGMTFIMPKGNVVITAEFETTGGSGGSGGGTTAPGKVNPVPEKVESAFDKFKDVKGHWAEMYMRAMVEKGLFMGISEDMFAPEHAMTRGMFVTVMGRLENAAKNYTTGKFKDVPSDMYYAPYVAWATEQGIVKGIEEAMFMPDYLITREQLAAILYRYAEYKGYALLSEESINLQSYKDYGRISGYALTAVEWAVKAGIIQGSDDGGLHPGNIATRAEVSAMLFRFIERYVK